MYFTNILCTFVTGIGLTIGNIMNEGTLFSPRVHHGRNIKRLREILGVKQDMLAVEFNITQQAVSDLEKKAQLSDEILEKVAKVLNVPVDVIKNFNDETAVNVIANTFNDVFHDNSSFIIGYQPTINQIDKLTEMIERLLKAEQEKNVLLEKMLAEKK
ncbi:transcriptional regulator [Bacteroidia bacterium]|nr:transcriptional regulator [Bacteroidia bacterium]